MQDIRALSNFLAAAGKKFQTHPSDIAQAIYQALVSDLILRQSPVVEAAQAEGVAIRGYVSCVTDCPFDGPTESAWVAAVVDQLRDLAHMQVSLGDTLGKGTPARIAAMLEAVTATTPADVLAGHFHDTGGKLWPISACRLSWDCAILTARWVGWADALMRPMRPEMSRQKRCSQCSRPQDTRLGLTR